jgi:Tol biopolymer transport system component
MRQLALLGLVVFLSIGAVASATGAAAHSVATGDLIVYSDGTGPVSVPHLKLLDLTSGDRRSLASGRLAHNASWSPDGTRLVVEDYGARASQGPRLAVITLRTGSMRRITHAAALDENPAWSPNGRRIVFSRAPLAGSDDGLWVMNAAGGGERHLTFNRFGDTCASWSPDGRQIAFARTRGSSGARDLWLMRADGKGQHRVVAGGSCAAWSPDGDRMAIAKSMGRKATACGCLVTDLYVGDSTGAGRKLLVRNGGHPSWSSDGTRLVFVRWQGSRTHLWLINADGTGLRQLTGGSHSQRAPAWQP